MTTDENKIESMNDSKNDFELQSSTFCRKIDFELIIKECHCTERALKIFNHFHKYQDKEQRITNCAIIFNELSNYSLTHFINDMDHVLRYHKQQINDGLFRQKITHCKLRDCRPFELNSCHIQKVSSEHMVFYQFIQEYHVLLFHDKQRYVDCMRYGRYIVEEEKESAMRHVFRRDNNCNIEHCEYHHSDTIPTNQLDINLISAQDLEHIKKCHSKFYKRLQFSLDIVISPDIPDETQSKIFSFGYKFEYHRVNKQIKNPYYVGCKYENLQKELIKDNKKNFSKKEWDKLIKFSETRAASVNSKQCIAHSTEYEWKTKIGKTISLQRVLAIILYTNYDTLQSALKTSFNAINSDKYPSKVVKRNHSRFAHWAMLLRSTVDIYGQKMNDKDIFFRGLRGQFKFKLFCCTFRGPMSTTTELGIAKYFADDIKPGIVVEIKKPVQYNKSRYLNISIWSSYKYEEEHLFNGPDNWLFVTTVNYRATFSDDQGNCVPLLVFQALTTKDHYINIGELIETSKINLIGKLNELVQYRNGGNDYLYGLVRYYINCVKSLKIQLKTVKELLVVCNAKGDEFELECLRLLDLFFDDSKLILSQKKLYISFEKLVKLFPNMEELIVDFGGWSLYLGNDNRTWGNMVEYMIKTKHKTEFKFIKIAMKRFPYSRCPSKEILNDIANKVIGTQWHVHYQAIQKKSKQQNKNIMLENESKNNDDCNKVHPEEIIPHMLAATKSPQHVLYFIRETNNNI